jgi:hypothetical protein
MTDLTKDETYDFSAAGERRTRRKKMLPKRLARLLVVLAAIVVLFVVIVLVAQNAINNSRQAAYQRYLAQISSMLTQSDSMGTELTKLLTNPGDISRKDLQTALDKYIAASDKQVTQAKALKAPSDLVDQGAQDIFVYVMVFRHEGLSQLEDSLMTALEVQETDVSAAQISNALYYLTNSDFLYKNVFAAKVRQIVKDKGISGATIPDTQFFADADLASKSRVQKALALLKSNGNLQEVHGIAVDKIVAKPNDQELSAGGTYNLTASDSLSFDVTVENQGNMSEKNVPVVVELLSQESATPQKVAVTIPELKSKEQLVVNVKGIKPSAYGQTALLRVEVGPVQGETFTGNNSIEAHVIFTL